MPVWFEGGAALDQVPWFNYEQCQQQKFELSGKLVLTSLTCDFYGEGQAFFMKYAVQHCQAYLTLVRTEAAEGQRILCAAGRLITI